MSNLVNHAERELRRAGLLDKDSDYGGEAGRAALELVRVFADQEHSGASAGLVSSLFSTLAGYGTLTPLTGEPDEWMEVGSNVWQNTRDSSVFKDADGRAYDIDAVVRRYPDGFVATGGPRHYIEFPYTKTRRIVDVTESGEETE